MTVPKGAKDCGVSGSGFMRRVGGEETRVGAISFPLSAYKNRLIRLIVVVVCFFLLLKLRSE